MLIFLRLFIVFGLHLRYLLFGVIPAEVGAHNPLFSVFQRDALINMGRRANGPPSLCVKSHSFWPQHQGLELLPIQRG